MLLKYALMALVLTGVTASHTLSVSTATEIADDEGDLNPQPLPPIAEDGIILGMLRG